MVGPLQIESLDHEGKGIARHDGKVMFIEGALPGEVVEAAIYRRKPAFEQGYATRILKESAARTTPDCQFFGLCGGCSLQHMNLRTQVAAKQRVLEDNLRHIGKVSPEQILPAIHGPGWGYRHRGRLTVRHVAKKGGVLVGFHEKRSSYVADMRSCEVLPRRISALLVPLRGLVEQLSIRTRLPQIELAITEVVDVLVLRVLEPLTEADADLVRVFADTHRVVIYLQPAGPETAQLFHPPGADALYYTLPEFDVQIHFRPTDFTQVNHAINQVLVRRALRLLDPQPGERIADLFCGLGNFTLPIARSGAQVTGIEGSAGLIRRAEENAQRNGLAGHSRFLTMDLFKIDAAQWTALGSFDKVLIDPPRDGAMELVKLMGHDSPRRIVYVSCNPATLARDAEVLVAVHGYTLRAAGIVNMFPHTAHVESMAWFERE
ncbi:MAG: 23S rRNA (uracil(1939)-C(5))-methyltransferase RlmD [Betaproteobacteria bacterium]|nr:MAG: 23S rRNA (uracil(1939)-C(5))-methyltransferase RlmD [Betaproteobacteria bacterium]